MLKPKDVAERLNISVKTLQRWDNEGILLAHRAPTNRRYYTEDQIQPYLHPSEKTHRLKIAYARVSHMNGKGVILDDVMTDIGSGPNYKRKKWNSLLDMVMESKVEIIYITYKDCFVRFGYEWFEQLCLKFDTKVVVLNNPDLSPQQEIVEDLVSIIHVFSSRIYGLRKYKKKIEEDDDVSRIQDRD